MEGGVAWNTFFRFKGREKFLTNPSAKVGGEPLFKVNVSSQFTIRSGFQIGLVIILFRVENNPCLWGKLN